MTTSNTIYQNKLINFRFFTEIRRIVCLGFWLIAIVFVLLSCSSITIDRDRAVHMWLIDSIENIDNIENDRRLSAAKFEALFDKGWLFYEVDSIDIFVNAADEIIQILSKDDNWKTRRRIAHMLRIKSDIYYIWGIFDKEIAIYDEIELGFGKYNDPIIRQLVVDSLIWKGKALSRQGKFDEAITVYDDIEQRFNVDSSLAHATVDAYYNKGRVFHEQGKDEKSIMIYDEIEQRFGTSSDEIVRSIVAKALRSKGSVLHKQGKNLEAIALYDEIDRRFTNDNNIYTQWEVARALDDKGEILRITGKFDEAIIVYDQIERRFGDKIEDDVFQYIVARVLYDKGLALNEQREYEKSVYIYSDIERRFGKEWDPNFKKIVDNARHNKEKSRKPN